MEPAPNVLSVPREQKCQECGVVIKDGEDVAIADVDPPVYWHRRCFDSAVKQFRSRTTN